MENQNNIKIIFNKGFEVLKPLFYEHGFIYLDRGSGDSSGGFFIAGAFEKPDRKFFFSYRYSLGEVIYQINNFCLDHDSYMKLLKVRDQARYPGFSNDSIQAYQDLYFDLSNFCQDFLSGSGENFIHHAQCLRDNPNMFKGLDKIYL